MTRLRIRLLGPFEATLDGKKATKFHSDKVRALLAYLCSGEQGAHRREKLAGLLWPDYSERSARANLRRALANLRKVIGDRAPAGTGKDTPGFLLVTRQTIQFNASSDAWVDALAFLVALEDPQPSLAQLEEAVALYRSEFMEGFSLPDSGMFEEWLLLQRERFGRLALEALHKLAKGYTTLGQYERALAYAWRQVELDPLREGAHRQLMRLLAYTGRTSEALAQYETCRRTLAREMGVEPSAETAELFHQIQEGTLVVPEPPTTHLPSFLLEEEKDEPERPICVGRERELTQLDQYLEQALAGDGRVVFLIGEPGSGKSVLAGEFVQRAMDANPDLLAARGRCNAYTGVGDPYLPFLEILQILTGDIETGAAGREISTQHARRLWAQLPDAVQALLDNGPELIDRFVPGAALLARARIGAPAQATHLAGLLDSRSASAAGPANLQQTDLFEQYTRVLKALSREHPLVLVVDDLQWADLGSIGLLFHLGRSLAGSRILLVGAYRPAEVALGRPSAESGQKRHPLEPVVHEFQRDLGDIHINLDETERRQFVEALLDTEPNRLGDEFREVLYRHTGGHPLFTVELLRGLQEQGSLTKDESGRWIAGPELKWDTLPPRVEAVIAERLRRLPEDSQSLLAAASVAGEEFTAEAVARVRGSDEDQVLQRLSGPLSQKHKLVQAQGFQWVGNQRMSRYRFRHFLFQKYLYNRLDPVQQSHLHHAAGLALETLHGDQVEQVAVQLARHFEKAGLAVKAVEYLLQAGDRAARLFANDEAIAHFKHGIELVETLGDTPQRNQLELELQLALGVPLMATEGFSGAELAKTYGHARELARGSEASPELFRALAGLHSYYDVRAELKEARETSEDLLRVAEQLNNPGLTALAYHHLSSSLLFLGHLQGFRARRQTMLALYDPERDRSLVHQMGIDARLANLYHAGWAYWFLGYPDQARQRSEEAVTLARERGHPFLLSFALMFAAFSSVYRREVGPARELSEETIAIAKEHGHQLWLAGGTAAMGWVLAQEGDLNDGVAHLLHAQEMCQAIGARLGYLQDLPLLADTYLNAGRVSEGLTVVDEALRLIREIGTWMDEPEIHRLRGELLLVAGEGECEAERCFQRAIEVARQQKARSWELRATMSLCRLWQKQGRTEAARERLAEIYGWFTEGFDTPDLMEAKRLLEALGGP